MNATAFLRLTAALLTLACLACAHTPLEPTSLNSERIRASFGSYGIEVLEADESLRVSNLYSIHGETRVCRTFAVVRFPRELPAALTPEHRQVVAGGSLGEVFVNGGWQINKKHLYVGAMAVPETARRLPNLMRIQLAKPLAVHVYELSVTRGDASYGYATIAELHHPDYLDIKALEALYGRPPPATGVATTLNEVAGLL